MFFWYRGKQEGKRSSSFELLPESKTRGGDSNVHGRDCPGNNHEADHLFNLQKAPFDLAK